MFHLAAYFQSVDPATALVAINAVQEQVLFTNGADLRIPADLRFLVAAAAAINDASFIQAQLQAPSLRVQANINVEPITQAANFALNPLGTTIFDRVPSELVEDEALNFFMQSDPAAAAAHVGLVWLADGPVSQVEGKVFTVRCTSSVVQTASTWVNGNLTLGQVLPAGRYQVVGARFRSTDAIAARLVFREQVARPGWATVGTIPQMDHTMSRAGRFGVWGEFPNTIPPTIDVLGGAASAQVTELDLIRVA
jgi:hypothetical protein